MLFVDDSTDNTAAVIVQMANEFPFAVRVIAREPAQRNGLSGAVVEGFQQADGVWMCVMDADLQHPPEEIPKLLELLETGFDVVYGAPADERHGLLRDISSVVTKGTMRAAMNVENARDVCAFREPLLLREIKHRSTSAIQSPWTFSPAQANSQQLTLNRISRGSPFPVHRGRLQSPGSMACFRPACTGSRIGPSER